MEITLMLFFLDQSQKMVTTHRISFIFDPPLPMMEPIRSFGMGTSSAVVWGDAVGASVLGKGIGAMAGFWKEPNEDEVGPSSINGRKTEMGKLSSKRCCTRNHGHDFHVHAPFIKHPSVHISWVQHSRKFLFQQYSL